MDKPTLLTLPFDVHVSIFRYVPFAGLVRLQAANRQLRSLLSAPSTDLTIWRRVLLAEFGFHPTGVSFETSDLCPTWREVCFAHARLWRGVWRVLSLGPTRDDTYMYETECELDDEILGWADDQRWGWDVHPDRALSEDGESGSEMDIDNREDDLDVDSSLDDNFSDDVDSAGDINKEISDNEVNDIKAEQKVHLSQLVPDSYSVSNLKSNESRAALPFIPTTCDPRLIKYYKGLIEGASRIPRNGFLCSSNTTFACDPPFPILHPSLPITALITRGGINDNCIHRTVEVFHHPSGELIHQIPLTATGWEWVIAKTAAFKDDVLAFEDLHPDRFRLFYGYSTWKPSSATPSAANHIPPTQIKEALLPDWSTVIPSHSKSFPKDVNHNISITPTRASIDNDTIVFVFSQSVMDEETRYHHDIEYTFGRQWTSICVCHLNRACNKVDLIKVHDLDHIREVTLCTRLPVGRIIPPAEFFHLLPDGWSGSEEAYFYYDEDRSPIILDCVVKGRLALILMKGWDSRYGSHLRYGAPKVLQSVLVAFDIAEGGRFLWAAAFEVLDGFDVPHSIPTVTMDGATVLIGGVDNGLVLDCSGMDVEVVEGREGFGVGIMDLDEGEFRDTGVGPVFKHTYRYVQGLYRKSVWLPGEHGGEGRAGMALVTEGFYHFDFID